MRDRRRRAHLMWALQCGLPSRRELYERLTASELAELETLAAIEPWGEAREDIRHAVRAALTIAPWSSGARPPRPEDFLPRWGEPAPRKTTTQMRAAFLQAKAAFESWRDGQRQH